MKPSTPTSTTLISTTYVSSHPSSSGAGTATQIPPSTGKKPVGFLFRATCAGLGALFGAALHGFSSSYYEVGADCFTNHYGRELPEYSAGNFFPRAIQACVDSRDESNKLTEYLNDDQFPDAFEMAYRASHALRSSHIDQAIQSGRFDDAAELASLIPKENSWGVERSKEQLKIVRAYLDQEIGNEATRKKALPTAVKIAKSITSDDLQSQAFKDILSALLKVEAWEDAFNFLQTIRTTYPSMANDEFTMVKYRDSLRAILEAPDGLPRPLDEITQNIVLAILAESYRICGHPEKAKERILEMTLPYLRTSWMVELINQA
jgi:hypothetical protein